jgi:ABC transporter family protein
MRSAAFSRRSWLGLPEQDAAVTEALIIETAELRKTYDDVEALRGLTMAVPRGSICGFLGRNGAGKTTAMKILLGMTHATSGSARVFDLPPDNLEIRRRTAFVSEEKDLYPYMTVEEIIHFTRSFFGGGARISKRSICVRLSCPRRAQSSHFPSAPGRNWRFCLRCAAARSSSFSTRRLRASIRRWPKRYCSCS